MRYDDPQRPRAASGQLLQTNGSALPAITLLPPELDVHGAWSWGLCAHCHVGGSVFRYHTGSASLGSLTAFEHEWFEDPEACLVKWLGYNGPERVSACETEARTRRVAEVDSLWD